MATTELGWPSNFSIPNGSAALGERAVDCSNEIHDDYQHKNPLGNSKKVIEMKNQTNTPLPLDSGTPDDIDHCNI